MVLYVGSSNFAAWHIAQANAAAQSRNLLSLVSEQSRYHLASRTVELEVLPACRALGVGLIPYGPLGGGLLAGAPDGGDEGRRAGEGMQRRREAHRAQLDAYEALCRGLGETPADVALAWLLHQPGVSAPIIGPRTLEQFTGSLRALETRLSGEVLEKLDAIWLGPGEAPEAYAW